MYDDEVRAFEERLIKRGRDKREAAIAEIEAEEREERLKASPGGLDPKEVFDTLPKVRLTCSQCFKVAFLPLLGAARGV